MAPNSSASEQLRKFEKVEPFGHSQAQKIIFFRQSLLIFPILQKLTHMHSNAYRFKLILFLIS